MKADKLRVVFDTSIYISAFTFPDSKSYQAYFLAVTGKILLFSSSEIIKELVSKLTSTKFGLTLKEAEAIVKRISKTATFVNPKKRLNVLSDEPDNRILECGIESKANLIVSGDHHLTDLKTYRGVGVIRAADLLYIVYR